MKYAKETLKKPNTPLIIENILVQSIAAPNSFQNNHEAMLYHIPFSHLCVKTSTPRTFHDQIIFKELVRIQY